MKVEKEKRRVRIMFGDGSLMSGNIYINPGERAIDFLNKHDDRFIVVTEVELYHGRQVRYFKLLNSKEKNTVLVNKEFIKMLEEI